MAEKIDPKQLREKVNQILNQYSGKVNEELKNQIKLTNRNALRLIKQKSPNPSFKGSKNMPYPPFKQATGRYAKGWRSKKMFENNQALRYWIFNKTDWQLTHLLEKGHELFVFGRPTGKRVEGVKHIEPVGLQIQKELPEGVKARIKQRLI